MRHVTLLAALASIAPTFAGASQTVALPAWVCVHPDALFVAGFEAGETPVPSQPSRGSGGAYPGYVTRQVSVSGLGTQPYYLYVPASYTPSRPMPMLLALHGSGGPGTADQYAQTVRLDWGALAYGFQMIVVAPVGTDYQYGGWVAPLSAAQYPSDYDIIAQVFDDVASAYNIETTRRYGWGYSAGGHVMHSLALNGYNATVNGDSLAAYSVSAGVLGPNSRTGWACRGLTDAECIQQVLAPAARKVPVDIHVGTTDPLLSYAQSDDADFSAAGWTPGSTLFFTQFAGGHTYSTADLQQAWSHLCPNAVVP